MSGKNSIQVAIKVRPLFRKEKDQQSWRVVDNSIQLIDSQTEPYYFDHIFDQDATNQIIFDKMVKQIVHSAIQGFNGTIFAYGQTSSGKTYTMMGDDNNPGVMVLVAKEIFKEIQRTQDRQFLLRVGYIEIYNEKIYDLLNTKNQDLKIHETSTGIVSVNCEEIIIRSEGDLLFNLDMGGKERTVGETNMNERSSRSHAIFRIIIESRKMDRCEDDAVIQSIINLVDLAGSERADQTGARGTRLKEGAHINKSLLFLSNVIKSLSENEDDKYISFRDSKLTRILQASLGGNALTAIICTIKPNAVEETQSTLNFALRAKSIKNKPQVNEIVSDATMMKRLEHEIKVLKTRLEEEQRKNESQLKVRQLELRINDEYLKIISCNSLHSMRNREKRRVTWAPSTSADVSTMAQQISSQPVPTISSLPQPSRLQAPKSYNTPLITKRQPSEPPPIQKNSGGLPTPSESFTEIDEQFTSAEMVNFDISPPKTTQQLERNISITPKVFSCPKSTLEKVEHDLLELQSFTNLENKIEVTHEPVLTFKHKIQTLSERITVLENERLEYMTLKNDVEITTEHLSESQKRCDELQVQLNKLKNSNNSANKKIAKYDAELGDLKKINEEANEKIIKYEAELAELKKTNKKLEMENRETVNLEFEFKRHKNKSKLRENELIEALNDKEKEVTKLEKSLNSITAERLRNSKEELLQKSLNESGEADVSGKVCIKCEDLKRILEENKKVIAEFEKLTLEYEKLKLNYEQVQKENETNKLKIVSLEELQKKEKGECEKLLLDVQQLRDKLHNVQSDYELLSSEKSSKHEECIALNKQVEVAKKEMVVLEEKFTKLESSWQEQQKTLNDIETQYVTIQTKYEDLQSQYEQLESSRGQSLSDYQRLEKENLDLQTEIEDLKNKVHDAQEKLLESNTKFEEVAKENKTAREEYSSKTSKVQQENEQLKKQLLEIQTEFENLQKEYDDLSNQLMDNLQDNEDLKNENTKLTEKVIKAEAEISELKLQEKILARERQNQTKTPELLEKDKPCDIDRYDVDTNGNEITAEYIEKLKQDIIELKTINEQERLNNKTLLESTERAFSELREQMTQIQAELLEKSMFVDNCACKNYQHQIENLEKEKADITVLYEELQEKVNNCTLNDSLNGKINITVQEVELKYKADNMLKELEELKLRENELLESNDLQSKTLEEMAQQYSDVKTNLETAREQLEKLEKVFIEKHHQLELENLQKLELSASEYRDNMKKYNKEWEERKEEYEQTIENLQNQIDLVRHAGIRPEDLKTKGKPEQLYDNEYTEVENQALEEISKGSPDEEHQDTVEPEDIEAIKEEKYRLQEEKISLQQQLNTAEDTLECLKEKSCAQYEELVLVHARLVFLEEHLADAKILHATLSRENSSLITQLDDIKEDVNCIQEMHDKNQKLSNEMENLNQEFSKLQEKLQKAESQVQEFHKEDASRKELIDILQNKLAHLTALEEEKKKLENDFKNIKQDHAQIKEKLRKTEAGLQEMCGEDASCEELIQTLQTKMCNMAGVEEEKKNLEIENIRLKETFNSLQVKETAISKEVESLKQEVEKLEKKVSKMSDSEDKLKLEKSDLEQKLQKTTRNKVLLELELNKLIEEKKTLNENCSVLQEQNTILTEQLLCLKEKDKAEEALEQIMKDKAELVQTLRLTTEKLENALNQVKEKENHMSQIRQDKLEIQQDLESLKKSIIEKHKQLEETDREKESVMQNNIKLGKDLQEMRLSLAKACEEKQKQMLEMETCKEKLAQLEQLSFEKTKQEEKDLQKFKESCLKDIEEKKQELSNFEKNNQEAQQENQKLQQELKNLSVDLANSKKAQQEKSKENTQLQTELHETKESLAKLQEEIQKLQEKLVHYQKLQEDKSKLEATFNVLKKAQMGALSGLQEEKDQLQITLQQYKQKSEEFKEKEETLKQKIDSLSQQLHDARGKALSYEKLLLEHEEVENALTSATATNQKFKHVIFQLTSQHESSSSKIENLSGEIKNLNLQLKKHTEEKQIIQTKLIHLQETLQGEKLCTQKDHSELKSTLEELTLKYDALKVTNTQLETLNQQMQEQLNSANEKSNEFNNMQKELQTLRVQHAELQDSLKKTVDEAGRCSLALRKDVEQHKQLLQKQLAQYNSLKIEMGTKQHSLTQENLKLSTKIEVLRKENISLEDKLRVRNFEQDLQRLTIDVTSNTYTSSDSHTSHSPKGRKSFERINDKATNKSFEEKLVQQKISTTTERKNRRLSTHDERRRQSYWGASHDKETMTDPSDNSCNCMELDRKLKECERNLLIKTSQVTTLNMELRNHPLKDENSTLKKRLQEEQERHRVEIKRYKNKLHEQNVKTEKAIAAAAHATAKSEHAIANAALAAEQQEAVAVLPKVVADVEVQTDDDLSEFIQKLKGKYNDLQNICRYRYEVIKELENKVAQKENSDGNSLSPLESAQFTVLSNQYESLKSELKTVKEKYENAKKVLHLRRQEIFTLRAQLGPTQQN